MWICVAIYCESNEWREKYTRLTKLIDKYIFKNRIIVHCTWICHCVCSHIFNSIFVWYFVRMYWKPCIEILLQVYYIYKSRTIVWGLRQTTIESDVCVYFHCVQNCDPEKKIKRKFYANVNGGMREPNVWCMCICVSVSVFSLFVVEYDFRLWR